LQIKSVSVFFSRCFSRADVIMFRDGIDVTSPVISYHCGTSSYLEILSTGENASLEFLSDGQTQRQGFAATFQFIHASQLTTASTTIRPTSKTTSTPAWLRPTNNLFKHPGG